MGSPVNTLRISEDANTALKAVAVRFPEWSIAQLGSKLLVESCRAILSTTEPAFPTALYIRAQISNPVENLADLGERYESLRVAEGAKAKKKQAAEKPAA